MSPKTNGRPQKTNSFRRSAKKISLIRLNQKNIRIQSRNLGLITTLHFYYSYDMVILWKKMTKTLIILFQL
jgi:hypothetical protein